jgi:flavin-dependent dehydrogenase
VSASQSSGVADVVVIGAGPSGATVGTRLAQLGHQVVAIDRGGRRRSHRCEMLAGVTLDLLELTGADRWVREAPFAPVETMSVEWDAPRIVRRVPPGSLLVDREQFDRMLVDRAVECGVTIFRPAVATRRRRLESGWEIELDDGRLVRARFLVDATGRSSALRRSRSDALLGVSGGWEGWTLERPAVVAIDQGWLWAAPGRSSAKNGPWYEVTVFVDPTEWRKLGSDPMARYSHLVEAAGLAGSGSRLVTGVTAADASGALAAEVCGSHWVAVGDAALAVDPLSSSGVQRAVQNALTAAVVIHTVLTSPADSAIALRHHRQMLEHAADQHAAWTGESYAAAAMVRPTAFWTARVVQPVPAAVPAAGGPPGSIAPSTFRRSALVRRAQSVRFVDVTQVIGDKVRCAPAVEHPAFDGAVAYVGGTPLVPLLASLDGVASIGKLVETWAQTVPETAAAALADWFLRQGVLEEVGSHE